MLQENGGMLSKFQLTLIIFVIVFLIYSDFLGVDKENRNTKFLISGLALLLLLCILRSH